MIPVAYGVILGAILFVLSIFGLFFNRKNVLLILMSLELMLLAVNINFVTFSVSMHHLLGQLFVFFVLTVAAAESAIGLAILVILFKRRATIDLDKLNQLKG
jgi:NADH-quinone oxidoreductase subunit K